MIPVKEDTKNSSGSGNDLRGFTVASSSSRRNYKSRKTDNTSSLGNDKGHYFQGNENIQSKNNTVHIFE